VHDCFESVIIFDKVFSLDGEPLTPKRDVISSFHNTIEDTICCYHEFLVSESAVIGTDHAFLTTGLKSAYLTKSCCVRLRIASWHDLPRCRAAFLWIPPRAKEPGYQPDGLDRQMQALRAKQLEESNVLGPHAGSFISCSLWNGLNLVETECVLELTGEEAPDQSQDAVLHVLSDSETLFVEPGMQLRIKEEAQSDGQANHPTWTDLAEIIASD
jgi:hypothetical protein